MYRYSLHGRMAYFMNFVVGGSFDAHVSVCCYMCSLFLITGGSNFLYLQEDLNKQTNKQRNKQANTQEHILTAV